MSHAAAEALRGWFDSACRQGYVATVGQHIFVLPDWLDSVRYERSLHHGTVVHRLDFDKVEYRWASAAAGAAVFSGGVSLRLAFAGPMWLYLPFPDGVFGRADDAVIIRQIGVPSVKSRISDPGTVGAIPHFYLA